MAECIFCKIVRGEIPSQIVFEGERVIAFRDINPQAPVHILLVPKKHINPMERVDREDARIVTDIFLTAKEVASKEGIADKGFRLISNVGAEAGQEIEHLHFHLLGGKKLPGLLA
ncbi:MAG: histidine triad nucleotide-binding protein [Actinomycetota bacterium]|nr:histidine triad nucleotide-binding protein [Actinomycetota bacterium]